MYEIESQNIAVFIGNKWSNIDTFVWLTVIHSLLVK